MWVEQIVTECDFTGKQYDTPQQGAGGVARGATGRWCVVMHAGPEYIMDNKIVVKSYEEARKHIEDHEDGWPDF